MSPTSHQDKVAVVTGGAQGIGQAIALGLADRGAHVFVVDLNEADETVKLITEAGGRAQALVADVTNEAAVTEIAATIDSAGGGADILVNNVGIFPFHSIDELDYATWKKVIAVNLDSQFLVTKALLPQLRRSGAGRIVNMTSNSIGLAVPNLTHYMASKMGVIGFTRALANDLADDGITVNAVGPTLSLTPGVRAAVPEALVQNLSNSQAIKRPGEAGDVVGVVQFLTSADSYFVTGQTIMSDGGLIRL